MKMFAFLTTSTLTLLFCINAQATNKIYSDVESVSVFYQQGKAIFNTSITSDGSQHFFTDSNPSLHADNRPTEIWFRDKSGAYPLPLSSLSIPADVHITPDGNTLYVTEYGAQHSYILSMERTPTGWLPPQNVSALTMPKGAGYPTSTNNGVIYFSSDGDIYRYNGSEVKKLPPQINSEKGEHDPFIAQDESFLIMVRQKPEIGDSNMYISFNVDGIWTTAKRLPSPFNLEKIDGSPYVTPDKKYLFFTSNRDGEITRTYQAPFKQYYTEQRSLTSNTTE